MTQIQTTNYSFLSKIKSHVNSSVILIVCTALALICANLPWTAQWYTKFWQTEMSLSIGDFNFFSHGGHSMTIMQVINDFLMAIFFLSVGLEIKREILVGELSSMKKALLPIIGACGGMIVPVLVYSVFCGSDPAMSRGMAIPMATDIAFSLGVLAIFSKRVPVGLKVFLAALAVADVVGDPLHGVRRRGHVILDIDFFQIACHSGSPSLLIYMVVRAARKPAPRMRMDPPAEVRR